MGGMRFDSVSASQFKGFTDKHFELSKRTDVIGRNASGKTTLGMALYLPFTGKDLSGKSNPEIHPNFMSESEPHIIINGSIDSKPIEIEYIQKDVRTKKQKEENAPVRISSKYKINSVDKTQSSFEEDLKSRGIDLKLYERLASCSFFQSLKEADKRKAIFELAENITDLDVIAALGEEVSEVAEMSESFTLEEIEAKAKVQKKTAEESVERIPDQIQGMESSKQQIDVPALTAKKQELEASIADIQAEFNKIQNVSKASIEQIIKGKRMDLTLAVNKANDAKDSKIRSAKSELVKAADEVNTLQFQISHQEAQIQRMQNSVDDRAERMNIQLSEYKKLKVETFPEDKTVCPTCGQKLPQKRIEQLKSVWFKDREQKLENMKNNGNALALEIKTFQKELESAKMELQNTKDCLAKQKEQFAVKEDAVKALQAEPQVKAEDLPEHESIQKEITGLELQLGDIDKIEADRARKLSDINQLRIELIGVEKELAKVDFNNEIDRKIEALRQDQREAAQNKADADKLIYQLKLISQKKNDMLSDSINSKFPEWMKFKLYDYLKNGEYKDCCVPLIQNDDRWYEYNSTANNALKLRADIAILEAFQKHYGMRIPIIVDNAECLDAHSKSMIQSETQLIFLTVVDDKDLTVTSI